MKKSFNMPGHNLDVHVFIKHVETERIHRVHLKFNHPDEIDRFVAEMPETLKFIKYEKVSSFYRA